MGLEASFALISTEFKIGGGGFQKHTNFSRGSPYTFKWNSPYSRSLFLDHCLKFMPLK